MEGPWIISAPLPAVESLALGESGEGAGTSPTMPLASFVAQLERLSGMLANKAGVWQAGETLDLAHLGAVGCAMSAAPVLGAAIRCFADFFGAVQSATATHLAVDGDLARFSYKVLDNDIWPRRADAELTLGIVSGLVRHFAPDADRVLTVQFEAERGRSHAAIEAHLGRAGRCGEDNVLSVPLRLLDRPAPTAAASDDEAASFRTSVRALEHHLHHLRTGQPVSDRVLELLLARMGQEATDQDTIARELGMSCRTLHRRLDAEGASFKLLCQTARRNIGHALLLRSDVPMIEIAMRLGYSDHTAFSRAFSRWFGASPRALPKAGSGRRVTT